jgi:hypothetical protein
MAFSKLIAGTAAALMVMTPSVASAETRAADSIPTAAKKASAPVVKAGYPRIKPKAKAEMGQSEGSGTVIAIGAGALAAIAIIVAATDS